MENVKNIISHFIDKDTAVINDSTIIDKTVVKGSILIHRMYAALAADGIQVSDYTQIKTYGDLLDKLNGTTRTVNDGGELERFLEDDNANIGVDIEALTNIPIADDFREHEFYRQNFTAKEISYCSLKKDPYQSFLGLFCAKEALCKVSFNLAKKPFSEIEISHTAEGRPVFDGYLLSISHTDGVAVAIAQKLVTPVIISTPEHNITENKDQNFAAPKSNNKIAVGLSALAFLISLACLAILFAIYKK